MKVLQRRTAIAAMASLVFAAAALAQMPTSPWKKGAPFPQPDEELYGVALNGKMYVIGGWDDGKAGGVNYEYNPATDKWTKKQPMPRSAHHAALAAANGKIYVMGGFVPPKDTAIPVGGAWEPIDNAWEYDPAADSWEGPPPLAGRRRRRLARVSLRIVLPRVVDGFPCAANGDRGVLRRDEAAHHVNLAVRSREGRVVGGPRHRLFLRPFVGGRVVFVVDAPSLAVVPAANHVHLAVEGDAIELFIRLREWCALLP